MATKRTKPEAPAIKAGKPAAKRKVAVGPVPTIKAITPPAPAANLKATRKPARKATVASGEKSAAAGRLELATEVIALRAYFIGLRRQESGQSGDSTGDWLEAERQLRTESGA